MTSRAIANIPRSLGRVLRNMEILKGIDLVGALHDLNNRFDRKFTISETG